MFGTFYEKWNTRLSRAASQLVKVNTLLQIVGVPC